MPSLSLPAHSLPLPSLSISLSSPSPSPSPSSTPVQSTPTPTPAPTPSRTPEPSTSTPTPSSTSTSSSTSSLPSSTPSPATPSTSTLPSTTTAPANVVQQPSDSSSTPITFATSASVSDSDLSSSVVVYTSATLAPSPSPAATSPSSSGFFANTGAVAGTFTVVGLVGIAGVIAVALLIIRRCNSRSYEDDMEYLDKAPDLSSNPPMTRVTSPDDGFSSDHGHYGQSPMVLASPPIMYYPDHAHALHPQAFSADLPASHGYPSPYPAGHAQDYATQPIYSPDNSYHPSAPRADANMPNPHEFADVELVSAPVPQTQTVPLNALRPSVKPTTAAPKQLANTRFSVDSFYAGIVTDNRSSGQAL